MATLTDLVNDVYLLTNRPDLVNQTKQAVRAATHKAHSVEYFYRDIVETGVSFTSPSFTQSLEFKNIWPRYRALRYIRVTDAAASQDGPFLTILSPEATVDSYNINKENIAYVAGDVIQIRTARELQCIFGGAYVWPDTTEATYSSWIADDMPWAIVYEAAAAIFKQIGFDEQSAMYRQLVAEQYAALRVSYTQPVGY
jgi:hypothetical protein